jgi:hypothetical protein
MQKSASTHTNMLAYCHNHTDQQNTTLLTFLTATSSAAAAAAQADLSFDVQLSTAGAIHAQCPDQHLVTTLQTHTAHLGGTAA